MERPKKQWLVKNGKRTEVAPVDDSGEPNVDTLNYAHMAVKADRFAQTGSCLMTILGWVVVSLLCLGLAAIIQIMNRGWDGFLQVFGWK
jgi:hypothetical protein